MIELTKKILCDQVAKMYSRYAWFDSVDTDRFGKIIIYVHFLYPSIWNLIPEYVLEKQVLIHFSSYKDFDKNKTTHNLSKLDNNELKSIIKRLKTDCGKTTLENIFFEVHDGENAVTNESYKFPKIKTELEKLYGEFGFDSVYDEVDY